MLRVTAPRIRSTDQCPLKPQRLKLAKRPGGGPVSASRKRKWPGDVCFGYNASGDCSYKTLEESTG